LACQRAEPARIKNRRAMAKMSTYRNGTGRASSRSFSISIAKQPPNFPPHGEERYEATRLEPCRPAAHPSRRRFAPPQDEAECLAADSVKQPSVIGRLSPSSGSPSPIFHFPHKGERSAEKAHQQFPHLTRRGTHLAIGASRLPALHRGDFGPSGPRFRARNQWTSLAPTEPVGFRRHPPHRVQPLKAAPLSWSGR
jgi:hypothetical protein